LPSERWTTVDQRPATVAELDRLRQQAEVGASEALDFGRHAQIIPLSPEIGTVLQGGAPNPEKRYYIGTGRPWNIGREFASEKCMENQQTLSHAEIAHAATDLLWSLAEAVAELPDNPPADTLETLRWCARQAIAARDGETAGALGV
jgi:hypothetical protein